MPGTGMETPRLPTIIRTARLVLRPHELEDVEAVLAFASDPEWARYLPLPQPYRRRDAEEFLAKQILLDRSVHPSWAVVLEGTLVGGINLRLDLPNRAGEIGYSIARSVWGRDIATEAAGAVLAAAFRTLPELNRIGARADARNVASQRVMEKVGMRREGVLRQKRLVRGEAIDEVWYGVLRTDLSPGLD